MQRTVVIGVVAQELRGDNARIKVLAYLKGKKYELDLDNIKDEFPPSGHVFAPSFYKRYNFDVGTFLKLSVVENTAYLIEEGDDLTIVDKTNSITKVGYSVIEIEKDIAEKGVINQDYIQLYKPSGPDKFYFKFGEILYGSFKIKEDKVVPNTGKEVKCWNNFKEQLSVSFNDKQILFKEPVGEFTQIDCMSTEQLADWFVKQIDLTHTKFIKERYNSKQLRQELESIINSAEGDKLFKNRFSRSIRAFDAIDLNKEHIVELSNSSKQFQKIYTDSLQIIKEETKKKIEIEEKLAHNERREKLQVELNNLSKDIILRRLDIKKYETELSELKQTSLETKLVKEDVLEMEQVNLNVVSKSEQTLSKEELTEQQIPIQHTIIPQKESRIRQSFVVEDTEDYLTLEEEKASTKREPYPDKVAYYTSLKNKLINDSLYSSKLEYKIFEHLAVYNCCFIPNTKLALSILKSVNNCTYVIQQAEADWLKFEHFWDNGLGELWDRSHKQPEKFHFLILQDMNLASPLCYAKPLLDLNAEIRRKLPFAENSWPSNFKILTTRLPSTPPNDIGLPLYKDNFDRWGAIVIGEKEILDIEPTEDNFHLLPTQLIEWNNISIDVHVTSLDKYIY